MNKLFISFLAATMLACGGGGRSEQPPVNTTPPVVVPPADPIVMGIFRQLKDNVTPSNSIKGANYSVAAVGSKTMSIGRGSHTSYMLSDGRVLITGPVGLNIYECTADIFDPVTETFTTTKSMFPQAVRFVPIRVSLSETLCFTEITNFTYNEVTDTIYNVSTSVNRPYYLYDNKILLVNNSNYKTMSILDVNTDITTPVNINGFDINFQYFNDTIICIGEIAYIFFPDNVQKMGKSNKIYKLENFNITQMNDFAYITSGMNLLPINDHEIIMYGGLTQWDGAVNTVQVFDTNLQTVTKTLQHLTYPVAGGKIETLQNGWQLISGGGNGKYTMLDTEQVHNYTENLSGVTGVMNHPRSCQSSVLLNNGTVLISGGYMPDGTLANDAEIYDSLHKLILMVDSSIVEINSTVNITVYQHLGSEVSWTMSDSKGNNLDSLIVNGVISAPSYATTLTVNAVLGDKISLLRIKVINSSIRR